MSLVDALLAGTGVPLIDAVQLRGGRDFSDGHADRREDAQGASQDLVFGVSRLAVNGLGVFHP